MLKRDNSRFDSYQNENGIVTNEFDFMDMANVGG